MPCVLEPKKSKYFKKKIKEMNILFLKIQGKLEFDMKSDDT